MPTGKVKWFSSEKGYGFIALDQPESPSDPEVFIHWSGIEGSGYKQLEEGDVVQFDLETGSKGKLQAVRAHVIR